VIRVRTAVDDGWNRTDALAGAVTSFWRLRVTVAAVEFNQHRIVDLGTEGRFDSFEIRPMPVCCHLHAVAQPRRQIGNELVGRLAVPVADHHAWNKLRVSIHRHPRPLDPAA
jgi:hypothetical protein